MPTIIEPVVKLVATLVLDASAVRCEGSSPFRLIDICDRGVTGSHVSLRC